MFPVCVQQAHAWVGQNPPTDWAERLAVNPRECSSTVVTGCAPHHMASGDGVQVLPSKLFNPCPQIFLFIKGF